MPFTGTLVGSNWDTGTEGACVDMGGEERLEGGGAVRALDSLGTRPSLAEEEEGLVNLHTYKFEVRGISAE